VVNLFTARVVKLITVTLANILTVGMVKVLDFSKGRRGIAVGEHNLCTIDFSPSLLLK
jgi:hypothetical protein